MIFGPILVLLLLVIGIWYLLDRREKGRLAKGLPRHSSLRLIFAAFATLTVLFSGGCGGIFLISWIADGAPSGEYVGWEVIAVISLPPLVIGRLVWWLAMRRKANGMQIEGLRGSLERASEPRFGTPHVGHLHCRNRRLPAMMNGP